MFGIFDPLTKAIDNTLGIFDGLLEGDLPTKNQLSKLVSDGVSIYTLSEVTGYSVEVLESILRE